MRRCNLETESFLEPKGDEWNASSSSVAAATAPRLPWPSPSSSSPSSSSIVGVELKSSTPPREVGRGEETQSKGRGALRRAARPGAEQKGTEEHVLALDVALNDSQ